MESTQKPNYNKKVEKVSKVNENWYGRYFILWIEGSGSIIKSKIKGKLFQKYDLHVIPLV